MARVFKTAIWRTNKKHRQDRIYTRISLLIPQCSAECLSKLSPSPRSSRSQWGVCSIDDSKRCKTGYVFWRPKHNAQGDFFVRKTRSKHPRHKDGVLKLIHFFVPGVPRSLQRRWYEDRTACGSTNCTQLRSEYYITWHVPLTLQHIFRSVQQ